MKTHELRIKIYGKVLFESPFFWHTTRLTREAPLIHVAKTNETETPFRVSKSLVLKLTGTRAIVLGWWRDSGMDEWEALMDALDWHEYGDLGDLHDVMRTAVRDHPNPAFIPAHVADGEWTGMDPEWWDAVDEEDAARTEANRRDV